MILKKLGKILYIRDAAMHCDRLDLQMRSRQQGCRVVHTLFADKFRQPDEGADQPELSEEEKINLFFG